MALLSRVIVPDLDSDLNAEDIFSTHLIHLFTDSTPSAHGEPGTHIGYLSPLFGLVNLKIPQHPDRDDDRQLFAHYLWNSSVIAAEGIEAASTESKVRSKLSCSYGTASTNTVNSGDEDVELEGGREVEEWQKTKWNSLYWDLRDCNVLELGAGTALPSIIALHVGARRITITDHPSSPAISTNAIAESIASIRRQSKPQSQLQQSESTESSTEVRTQSLDSVSGQLFSDVQVCGYSWGERTFYEPPATTLSHEKPSDVSTVIPATPQPVLHSFDKIIMADCLWMPSKHHLLCKTVLDYLGPQDVPSTEGAENRSSTNDHRSQPRNLERCVLVTAGFHTGRAVVADFLTLATGSSSMSSSFLSPNAVSQDQPGAVPDSSPQHIPSQAESVPLIDNQQQTPPPRPAEDAEHDKINKNYNLTIAEIFEIDIDGRRREWSPHGHAGEDHYLDKRWCMCAVLVHK